MAFPPNPFAEATPELRRREGLECPLCKVIRPIGPEHWIMDAGVAQTPCICCLETMKQRDTLEHKKVALENAAKQLVAAAKQDSLRFPHIANLYARIVEDYGGADAFCDLWVSDVQRLREYLQINNKPPNKTLFEQYMAVFRMGAAVGQQQLKAAEQLSDQELRAELMSLLSEAVRDEAIDVEPEAIAC